MSMTPHKRMIRCRSRLLLQHRFYGTLLLNLKLLETAILPNNEKNETMATDGTYIYYNPEFVMKLDDDELEGVMVHELRHCTNKHMTRRKGREPKKWNIACDFAINPEIVTDGFTLPKGALLHPAFMGMGAEEIYDLIEDSGSGGSQNQPAQGAALAGKGSKQPNGQNPASKASSNPSGGKNMPGNSSIDPAGTGGVLDANEGLEPQAKDEIEAKWDKSIRQAAAVAKGAGQFPAGMEALYDEMHQPRITWREMVRTFIDNNNQKITSWSRPNKKFLGSGFYLPGYTNDGVRKAIFAIDTSSSIDQKKLSQMIEEVTGALDEGVIAELVVVYADTKVHRVEEYIAGDTIDAKPVGKGGTNFDDTFRWVGENAPDASCVIYFTDMDTRGWGEDIVPTLWAFYGTTPEFEKFAPKAPFGTPVHVL